MSTVLENKPRVLVVDPIASADYLITELHKFSIETFILFTIDLTKISSNFSFKSKLVNEKNIFIAKKGIIDIAKFKRLNIDYVICGYEDSVAIADYLMKQIATNYSNDPCTSQYRNNKYLMHKVLKANQLNYIKQEIISPKNIKNNHFSYPCFIKPLNGSASVGAAILNSEAELNNYIKQDFYSPIGRVYKEFIISEYIQGIEYAVDTFSKNGEHCISFIQRHVTKIYHGVPVTLSLELEKDTTIIAKIAEYAKLVLTKLGLRNGFAHTEIFFTAEHKPVLIELNPRISGASGALNILASCSGLDTQIEIFAQKIFNKELAKKEKFFSKVLCLYNFSNKPLPDLSLLKLKYPSINIVDQKKPVGYTRANMLNLYKSDVVAFITLKHKNLEQLEKDYKNILALDLNSNYFLNETL
ncbi:MULTISPECIES: ATP-grasp domain-containing protein [Francisella]|uniref:ATP-grasp domain-containing protein n=1 Tax=Francisella opportunistica TaxID=2016517 RepID=A0A345JPT5_9GAMM|nr:MULTISPECIES: ATP-grasp domain-containing protein [Francisella]APC91009.1 Argininosuccinate lyase [Francisella sp. MA067296]AXH29331.1 ATP-grasp domain-containing protein [Francisella opportunistica]AXH30982.1 argininosuccinate lyase [Francisella opportunistica]AXH32629.1 argininosuccinate lyase [Francisella opportunistica]